MPRHPRIVCVDHPHHVTQRGNNKRVIFFENQDYFVYLKYYQKHCAQYFLTTLAFCLMPNHVHFIVIPKKSDSISLTFKLTHTKYAKYLNSKHYWSGHLWQGRFFSCVLSKYHLISAIRYVERNPLRANLTDRPTDWPWSSAPTHVGEKALINLEEISNYVGISSENWLDFLKTTDEKIEEKIKIHTRSGNPLLVSDTGV
jgi:putative transposase